VVVAKVEVEGGIDVEPITCIKLFNQHPKVRFFGHAGSPQIDKSIRGPWPGEPWRQSVLVLGVVRFSNSVPNSRIVVD
jgi:hypothetical protein